jgi:alginate O-acetyltransferase complex protein AlgI
MAFNSPQFLLFLPLVVLLYGALQRSQRPRDGFLLLASYLFYMSWDWRYAGLIAFSTLVDWRIGLALDASDRPRLRRALLITSLVVNLGLLAVFKYWNFFFTSAEQGLGLLGFDLSLPHHHLLLPVGISFYTFQTLSYTIDVYKRQIPVERDLVKFSLFVSFFPQLVAGPIVRASDFLHQLHREPSITEERVRYGLWRVFRGLFKKVIIADLLANFAVDAVFADPGAHSSVDLLVALYAYAFQIYNDFSGYSDVAIGAAAMLGFEIPENFNRPYLSRNVREFWTRWHISLSTWLRDYLYIPLGGNRSRTTRNLMITMLLGGLWHGAALNFVLWGAYHGLLLIFARSADRHAPPPSRARVLWQRIATFHLVVFGWLLFRVTGWRNFTDYLSGLARLELSTALHPYLYAVLALAVALHLIPSTSLEAWAERFRRLPTVIQGATYALAVLVFCGATVDSPAFIYFQF